MKLPRLQQRTLALIAVVVPLLVLFVYVALRSGPLSPVAVTIGTAEQQAVAPSLSGIGTVRARYTYKIGPTYAGRLRQLNVHVGDQVSAGQILGEMDPVDLDERIAAQVAAIKSAEAALRQSEARQVFAKTQAKRYERLLEIQGTSEESTATKLQELALADAALGASREDVNRMNAELKALRAQRSNLRLIAPVAGILTARHADPGTTVVAGQAVIEMIDPSSLWVDARFDQISSEGLAAGLPARIVLRSRRSQSEAGRVFRVEPQADVVTEETLAKIVFEQPPSSLPPLGELAEVTVQLPQLPAKPTISNAAIRTVGGKRGVWKLVNAKIVFTLIVIGRSDLEGRTQIEKGLSDGDQFVLYSERALTARSRIEIVETIPGVSP